MIHLSASKDALLAELKHATGRPVSDLVGEAVVHLHRTYIGLAPGDPQAPKIDTGPFRKRYSDRSAEIVLRQVDATHFQLEEPVRFLGAHGAQWIVPASDVSDLASVPSFLTWLVPRYGTHTLAALLHDHLQKVDVDPPISRRDADDMFRDAMGLTGVPLVRRWLMWSAVGAATRLKEGGAARAATLVWVLGYAALGIGYVPQVVWAISTDQLSGISGVLVTVAVIASPLALGLLWRDDCRFAIVSAFGAMTIGYAVLADIAVYGAYLGLETLSRGFQRHPLPIRKKKLKTRRWRRRPGWGLLSAAG